MNILYDKKKEKSQDLRIIFNEIKERYFGFTFNPFNLADDSVEIKAFGCSKDRIFSGLRSVKVKFENIEKIEYLESFKQIQIFTVKQNIIVVNITLDK